MADKGAKDVSESPETKGGKMPKKKRQRAGKCPRCGKEDIVYGSMELSDNSVGYPFHCNICDGDFMEWYDLTYSETLKR